MSKQRLESNRKILNILKTYVENNPNQRFVQILNNIGLPAHKLVLIDGEYKVQDAYFEESAESLEIIKQHLNLV